MTTNKLGSTTKRRYQLTPKGLKSLRSSTQHRRPWESSTGPRTPGGKARVSRNALKHGCRSAAAVALRKMATRTIKELERIRARLRNARANGKRLVATPETHQSSVSTR